MGWEEIGKHDWIVQEASSILRQYYCRRCKVTFRHHSGALNKFGEDGVLISMNVDSRKAAKIEKNAIKTMQFYLYKTACRPDGYISRTDA